MIRNLSKRFVFLFSVVASLVVPGGVFGTFIEFSVGGTNEPNSILTEVNAFRAALGGINNGSGPGTVGGRREINWDGGGAITSSPSPGTPFDVFLNSRGARSTTQAPGTGFNQALPGDLSSTFGVFSENRIFSPVSGRNLTDVFFLTDVSFFIPGTSGSVPAAVSGFGAVFTSVDLLRSTSIQFFGTSNNLTLFPVRRARYRRQQACPF